VPHKNIRELAGHPLLAYTIQVAKDSGLFDEVFIVSDEQQCVEISLIADIGFIPEVPIEGGQDSWWINQSLVHLHNIGYRVGKYYILRPTSPFRTVEMLMRAEYAFNKGDASILKALEPVKQRPEKMWHKTPHMAHPYVAGGYHYEPSHTFEDLYIQNASLEIRRYGVPMPLDGPIVPFLTQGYEGFDINEETDFLLAEALVERGLAELPKIK
jgi:N-acylneuraminate cytidylyltransferase